MKIGEKYIMTMPNGDSTKVELTNIRDYPATGMPIDYEFTYLKGEKHLFKSRPESFYLPMALINQCKLEKIEGEIERKLNNHNDLIKQCLNSKNFEELENFEDKLNHFFSKTETKKQILSTAELFK